MTMSVGRARPLALWALLVAACAARVSGQAGSEPGSFAESLRYLGTGVAAAAITWLTMWLSSSDLRRHRASLELDLKTLRGERERFLTRQRFDAKQLRVTASELAALRAHVAAKDGELPVLDIAMPEPSATGEDAISPQERDLLRQLHNLGEKRKC